MRDPSSPTPGWVEALGLALAEALPRLHGATDDPRIGELIAALTAALGRGELEVDLGGPAPAEVDGALWPQGHRQALQGSLLCREPDGPLALEGERLQWRRWQRQRQTVLETLIERAGAAPLRAAADGSDAPRGPAPPPPAARPLDRRQAQAVAAVLRHRFVLLEGGPGTGKTSTVAAMVAAFQGRNPGARLHLAAPTGKAAARLRQAAGTLVPCTTLHRLLESRGDRFGRNRERPLALDLLVVDEVSMVDLGLLGAVLEALPAQATLVLVGDPAQLPPIAPGAVLLELQRPVWRDRLGETAVTLTTAYRNDGAIARVAGALRQDPGPRPGSGLQDPIAPIRPLLRALGSDDNLRWLPCSSRSLPAELLERLRRHQAALAELAGPCAPGADGAGRLLLAERDRLLVLAPQRRGRWGLEAIHRALLGERLEGDLQDLPPGTPVLCRRNLPDLDLANGDVGVRVGEAGAAARLLFGDAQGGLVWVHPGQLSGVAEPALALTVHKAQGSEAEEVIVLLPAGGATDRRLLYTALTRARQRALLLTEAEAEPPDRAPRDRGPADHEPGANEP